MPKFRIKKSTDGQYFWRFVADNGEPICHSETYPSKQTAQSSVDLVRRFAASATVVDDTVAAAAGYRR